MIDKKRKFDRMRTDGRLARKKFFPSFCDCGILISRIVENYYTYSGLPLFGGYYFIQHIPNRRIADIGQQSFVK
jgi:hypothetical protein